MAYALRRAENCAADLDRYIVRQVRRYPGAQYERRMHDLMPTFFSKKMWARYFELRFTFGGMEYSFMGYDDQGKIMDMTSNEAFGLYGNVHRLKSMLRNRTFDSLNKWGAACQNAVGGNIASMPLAGRLFAAGQRYEDLVLRAKAAREAAGVEVSDESSDSEVSDESESSEEWVNSMDVVFSSNPESSDDA